jgi:hypothetical protein
MRSAIVFKPATLLSPHRALIQRKNRQPFSSKRAATAIKTVPYAPLSHPFVERVIGTFRRECLDRLLFWTAADLERKLVEFQRYYNELLADVQGLHRGEGLNSVR